MPRNERAKKFGEMRNSVSADPGVREHGKKREIWARKRPRLYGVINVKLYTSKVREILMAETEKKEEKMAVVPEHEEKALLEFRARLANDVAPFKVEGSDKEVGVALHEFLWFAHCEPRFHYGGWSLL